METARPALVELLLLAVSGSDSQPADHRVSLASAAPHSRQTTDLLGWFCRAIAAAVWHFVQQQRGRLWLEFLPAYAPELNPVEYLWSHWKQHELPNFCPTTFGQLSQHARQALRRMRRRSTLVIAFWSAAISLQLEDAVGDRGRDLPMGSDLPRHFRLQHPVRHLLIIAIDRNSQCICLTGSSGCRTSPESVATPKSVAPPERIEACGATAAP
jgi:hypothetical protein